MKVSVEFQEPDRKKNIKRIIVKKSLKILGIIAIIILSLWVISSLRCEGLKCPLHHFGG
jgi:hypothetical protein